MKMTDKLDATKVAMELSHVSSLERRLVRNRIENYSAGYMPRWTTLVQNSGLVSVSYFMLVGLWTPILSVSGLAAAALSFFGGKNVAVVVAQSFLYLIACASAIMCVTRLVQGRKAGKYFREHGEYTLPPGEHT